MNGVAFEANEELTGSRKTESPNIVPAAAADLPALAELAGVIWRACYPGIITPAQIDYMLVT